MRFACSFVALFVLAACGDEPDSTAPAPETPVVEAQTEPVLCRPEGVEPASLSIGPLDLAPGGFQVAVSDGAPGGGPTLNVKLDEASARALGRITADTVNQPLPVIIDGETVMSPIVREPILSGTVQVSGQFTRAELEALAERFAPPCAGPEARAPGDKSDTLDGVDRLSR